MTGNTKILLEIAHKIEAKYGVESGKFDKLGKIVFEKVIDPSRPNIFEEVGEILKQIGEEFGLKKGNLTHTVHKKNLIISMPTTRTSRA